MLLMQPVQIPHDAAEPRLDSRSKMGAGMKHKGTDSKLLAPQQFIGKGAERFFVILGSLDTEIDQVSGMGNDGAESFTERVMREGKDFGLRQRLGKPLHIVLHKNLDGRASDPDTAVNGTRRAPDSRHMRAEQRKEIGLFLPG